MSPAVWRRHPSNLRRLEQLAKEEWSKIPVERCKELIDGYRKRLICYFFQRVCYQILSSLSHFVLSIFGVWNDIRFGFFSMCFSNANKINKHVNTKTFVIATFFWEKWCIIWQKCRGANIFDHDCRWILSTKNKRMQAAGISAFDHRISW